MIGAAGSSPLLTSQMYQKMFAQVDTNADGSVSLDELVAMNAKSTEDEKEKTDDVLQSLDKNGDGKLQANEFVPDKLFDNQTLGTMLTAQEYRDADPEAREAANRAAIDALFARADINGDGLLDQGEMDADKALRRAESLDTGKLPDIAYLTKVTDDGKLSRDDIVVGRMMQIDVSKAIDLSQDQSERFAHIKEAMAQYKAEQGTQPSRTLDDLRAEVQTELDTKPLSTELISRLFARLSQEALSRAAPFDQTA